MTEKILTDKILVICYLSIEENKPTIQIDFNDFTEHLAIKNWLKEHVRNAEINLMFSSLSPSQVYRLTSIKAKLQSVKHVAEGLAQTQ